MVVNCSLMFFKEIYSLMSVGDERDDVSFPRHLIGSLALHLLLGKHPICLIIA